MLLATPAGMRRVGERAVGEVCPMDGSDRGALATGADPNSWKDTMLVVFLFIPGEGRRVVGAFGRGDECGSAVGGL